MNKHKKWFLGGIALSAVVLICVASTTSGTKENSVTTAVLGAPKLAVVNFGYCLENSKLGREEKSQFDGLKKQIEQTLQAKEKELNELAPKFNDEYIDTLTPEAEAELKQKFKALSQGFSQQRDEYYQMLQQAHMGVVQLMHDAISQAAKQVSQDRGITCTLNEEACFFYSSGLDLSKDVVLQLDKMFDAGIFAAKKQDKDLAGKKEANG